MHLMVMLEKALSHNNYIAFVPNNRTNSFKIPSLAGFLIGIIATVKLGEFLLIFKVIANVLLLVLIERCLS